jgi:O-methyltransferase
MSETEIRMEEPRKLYLELLKKTLLNHIYPEADSSLLMGLTPRDWIARKVARIFGVQLSRKRTAAAQEEGTDWPRFAHSMSGMKRLSSLQDCVEVVIAENVPGDLIETGVWRGGACILMRGVLAAYGIADRRVWVADSFQGLPPPSNKVDKADIAGALHQFQELAVSLDQVKLNFFRYGLLDDRVVFLKGWFRDTLPTAPIEKLAIARLDGDLYESTMDAIAALYPKLSVGGYLIVDDYGLIPACKNAIEDYRQANAIREPIVTIDSTGVYWRRER